MPRGVHNPAPLPICAYPGCPHPCKRRRNRFCSEACASAERTRLALVSPTKKKCKREGCENRVHDSRNDYCSVSCFGRATRGVTKAAPPGGRYTGECSQITISPENHSSYRPASDSWWTKPELPREGLTALACGRVFSPARNAQPTHFWTPE